MKKLFNLLLIIFILFGCVVNNSFAKDKVPSKTALQIRDVQTKYFDTKDTNKVTKAVINTLQDNGFIIQDIEPDLGYLKAKKEIKLKRTNKGRVSLYSTCIAIDTACLAMSFGANPAAILDITQNSLRIANEVAPHTVIFDSNVNIERVGKKTKVRFTVIEKVLENADGYTTVKSSPRKVVRHYEPEIYQEFFNQVGKNLFIEKNI